MENISKNTPLQKKIALLTALRQGKIEKSHLLLQQLAQTSKTQPQLYQKFNRFITQHKSHIIQVQEQEKQGKQEPEVVIVDGDSDDDWKTDESVSLQSEEEKETQDIEPIQTIKGTNLLKNIVNSKSAILLKPVKDVKRQFLVQTKPKQNTLLKSNFSSTINLRQERPKSNPKQPQQLKVHYQTTKPYLLPKKSIKQIEGAHFPPINTTKNALKL